MSSGVLLCVPGFLCLLVCLCRSVSSCLPLHVCLCLSASTCLSLSVCRSLPECLCLSVGAQKHVICVLLCLCVYLCLFALMPVAESVCVKNPATQIQTWLINNQGWCNYKKIQHYLGALAEVFIGWYIKVSLLSQINISLLSRINAYKVHLFL